MKKRGIVFVITLAFIVGPILANAATPQERNGLEPEFDVDIWIDPYGWHHIYYTDLSSSYTIYVEIEVTSGPGIDFFICDQANWDIWDGGGTASVYNLRENVGSVSTSFNVPTTDTWYIVFDSDSSQNIHVEGYVGLTPAPATTNPSPGIDMLMIVVIIVAVIVIGAIGVVVVKQISGQGSTQPQTAQQVYTPQPKPSQSFCPYCGHPRQGLDAKFCSKCGRSFEGPEMG